MYPTKIYNSLQGIDMIIDTKPESLKRAMCFAGYLDRWITSNPDVSSSGIRYNDGSMLNYFDIVTYQNEHWILIAVGISKKNTARIRNIRTDLMIDVKISELQFLQRDSLLATIVWCILLAEYMTEAKLDTPRVRRWIIDQAVGQLYPDVGQTANISNYYKNASAMFRVYSSVMEFNYD